MQASREKLCSVERCDRPAFCRGWCSAHYERWRKTGDLREDIDLRNYSNTRARKTCSLESCSMPIYGLGFCRVHWRRAKENGGDPLEHIPAAGLGYINKDGYRYIHAPDHPNAFKQSGMILEHRYIMPRYLDRPNCSPY